MAFITDPLSVLTFVAIVVAAAPSEAMVLLKILPRTLATTGLLFELLFQAVEVDGILELMLLFGGRSIKSLVSLLSLEPACDDGGSGGGDVENVAGEYVLTEYAASTSVSANILNVAFIRDTLDSVLQLVVGTKLPWLVFDRSMVLVGLVIFIVFTVSLWGK